MGGEQVVKACLEAEAHHVDLSGEPQYLETMQLRYHEEAERKGVYIVGSCGFDSIPADLGSMVLAKAMGGDVATIEKERGQPKYNAMPKSLPCPIASLPSQLA